MTTTVSSRSMSIIQLPLNIAIGGSGGGNGSPNTAVGMHSDTRLGVHATFIKDERLASPPLPNRYSTASNSSADDSPKNQISFSDLDRLSMIGVGRKTMIANDDLSDARSSSVSSYQADSYNNRGGSGCEQDDDEDRMSCCSDDDSELSVGKEVDENDGKNVCVDDDSDADDDEDDIPDGTCTPATERTMLCGSEADVSNDESSRFNNHTAAGASPAGDDPSPALRFPIIRPSPTRLQEEFLRNSQLYAEELMKHQMNFMTATKVLNISPKLNEHAFGFPVRPQLSVDDLNPLNEPKIGFRPHIRLPDAKDSKWATIDDRCSQSPDGINFRGIHSHLNAISRITSALGRDVVGMASLTSPGSMTSRESSQSPPNNLHRLINNNIINDSNLKFSIDNILKPGFGRRITDPLLKRNKTGKKLTAAQRAAAAMAVQLSISTNSSSVSPPEKHVKPIDLTATTNCGGTAATTTATTTTSSINASPQPLSPQSANETTDNGSTTTTTSGGGNKSSSPMVWPAWVYCTRYSDRPSSGRFNSYFYRICAYNALYRGEKRLHYI